MKIYEVTLRVRTVDGVTPEAVEGELNQLCGESSFGIALESIKPCYLTFEQVDRLAGHIHAGQTDKIGVPYIDHVRAVGDALAPCGESLQQAGLLHDAIEDGEDWTAELLLAERVDPKVVDLVMKVTNVPGEKYLDKIRAIAPHYHAALLKIADNAHNSRVDRRRNLDDATRRRLDEKDSKAREILWSAVHPVDVEMILKRVNLGLLSELHEMYPILKER